MFFECPHLDHAVELTEERAQHIADRHPDLLPEHLDKIAGALREPDSVRSSGRLLNARLFARWYDDLRGGKYVVVVVVSEAEAERHWIVTAYIARRLAEGSSR
jgi:hypothetical protein